MRIEFDSGGGVTGPAGRRTCRVDTDALPPAAATTVTKLVAAANLPALVNRPAPTGQPRPDEMYYDITVADGGRTVTVSATDRDMPPGLRPLISWLTVHAAGS